MGKQQWTAPPTWPPPPAGWTPSPGWTPDPAWGPAPEGWAWWQLDRPGAAHQPFWKVKTVADTSPRFKKSLAGLGAVIVLIFAAGVAAGGNAEQPASTAATNATSLATPSAASPTPTSPPSAGKTTPAPRAAVAAPAPAPVSEAPPTVDEVIAEADHGTALALLGGLAVQGRAAKTGYDRDVFGPAWADTDRNGCDTRNDILGRDLAGITYKAGTRDCKVLTGSLTDPYTGQSIAFTSDDGRTVQIDHVVALSDAWQKGAQQWEPAKRLAFANDPLNLLAVDGLANGSKSDGDAATWLPPNKGFRCSMVARQVAVKNKYDLWITAAERDAMARVLTACPTQPAPTSGHPTSAPIAPARPVAPPPPMQAPAEPPPAPAEEPAEAPAEAGDQGGVTPGAFCSPEGATGTGKKNGKRYTCTRHEGEERARWRQ